MTSVAISQTFSPPTIYQATILTYTIIIQNTGFFAISPTVTDTYTVPGTFFSVTSTPNPTSSSITGSGFVNTYGSLAPGSSITITATFAVNSLATPGNYANSVRVTAFLLNKLNTIPVSVSAGTPVLEIGIDTFPKQYNVIDMPQFIGPIRNTGTATAVNVAVNFTCTSPGFISSSPYGSSATNTLIASLPNLVPGELSGYTFVVTVPYSTGGVFQCYATLSASNAATVSDSVSYELLNVTIHSIVNDGTVVPNQVIFYTLTLENKSGTNLTGYSISNDNTLPGAFTGVTSSTVTLSNLNIVGNTFTVDLGSITTKTSPPYPSIIATYTVSGSATPGLYYNTAVLHSPTQADNEAVTLVAAS